ncbi:transmembrane protein 267 [Trichoplusia ni]|uniref:Transmembrane protein 267 n=1 Tax=Trichoplusia ni TaxID=7111 RepID=A0A7E5X5S4_TRINI|nr:transmembrane protein 267 [Trichoplusia ni]
MRFLKVILSIAIICSAYVGDYVVFRSKYSSSHTFRSLADCSVHATLGFLSSAIFFSHEHSLNIEICVLNVLICTFVSLFIDIDHAFVARSIYLKDMTNLKQRGIFHCTTFWLLITILLLLYSYFQKKINIYLLSFMLILAYSSHHLRDGNRRGLWLYPFGSSPPIDKHLYIFLLTVLPHAFAYLYHTFKGGFVKNFVVYSIV